MRWVERPWWNRFLYGDPFDRMLVAQALVERATLVTRDAALAGCGVDVLW